MHRPPKRNGAEESKQKKVKHEPIPFMVGNEGQAMNKWISITLLIACLVLTPNIPKTTVQIDDICTETTETTTEPQLIEFIATAYCPCEKCCGKWAKNRKGAVRGCKGDLLESGKTIAVDFKTIPYGSTLVINGKEYKAVDCGGAIKGNRIDFYFDNHEEAVKFGKQVVYGYIKEEEQ